MSLTAKQREWVHRRDEQECQFPVVRHGRWQACKADAEEGEIHHILPSRFAKKWLPDWDRHRPWNLVLCCKRCHQKIHPDTAEAYRRYRYSKQSFTRMIEERDRLVAEGKIYWQTQWDLLLSRIARKRTQSYLAKNPNDPYPYN